MELWTAIVEHHASMYEYLSLVKIVNGLSSEYHVGNIVVRQLNLG